MCSFFYRGEKEILQYIQEIVNYFPINIRELLLRSFEQNIQIQENLQEIRIRVMKPIMLRLRNQDVIIQYLVTTQEVLQTLEKLCENSIYAYKNQICDGFITIKGGHRIGLTGTAVIENNKIINVKYVTSLNIRIARQVFNCSNKILREVLDLENQNIFNYRSLFSVNSSFGFWYYLWFLDNN